MKLETFKYWIRLNKYPPRFFGTGTKRNPIRPTGSWVRGMLAHGEASDKK